jgi:SAM-dependent methyltransferase
MTKDLTDPDQWWKEYGRCYADRSWSNYRAHLAQLVSQGLSGPILDVGCGYGFLVECARRFGIPAVGLEASSSALEEGRRRHPLADLRPWNAGEPLPVADASVGIALCNEFVDHISMAQNHALLDELHRALSPSGVLVVNSPSRFNRFDDDEGHISFFSPREFAELVVSHQFEIVSQPYTAQPLLGQGRLAGLIMRLITRGIRPESWAARIDLVARKHSETALPRRVREGG